MPAPPLPRLTLTLELEDSTAVLAWWELPDTDSPADVDDTPNTGIESALEWMRTYLPIAGP